MRVVIADTGPVNYLILIQHIDLLPRMPNSWARNPQDHRMGNRPGRAERRAAIEGRPRKHPVQALALRTGLKKQQQIYSASSRPTPNPCVSSRALKRT